MIEITYLMTEWGNSYMDIGTEFDIKVAYVYALTRMPHRHP